MSRARLARLALLTAGVAAGLVVLVRVLAFDWPAGRAADRNVLEGFTGLNSPGIEPLFSRIAHLADPKPFTYLAVGLIALALLRKRPRTAMAILVVCAGANVTTQLLKPALTSVRHAAGAGGQIGANAWPSGHATASLSLALCGVMAVSARRRPAVAALGAAFSIGVVFSLLADAWHFPSDVVAGYLIAAAWTALAISAVWAADARWPRPVAPSTPVAWQAAVRPAVLTAVAALVAAGLLLLARPAAVSSYAHRHTTFVIGAAVIAALGLALASALAVTLTALNRPPAAAAAGPSGGDPAATAARRRRWLRGPG